MEYSAGMMSIPFLFIETRKTASLVERGMTSVEIKHEVLSQNIYQMSSLYRSERYCNMICRRLSSLSLRLIKETAEGDVQTAKLLVLISIMHTDLLFREFMAECFYEQLQLGMLALDDIAVNSFFSVKATQSEIVAGWNDSTIVRLKRYYIRILFECNLISSVKPPRNIQKAWLPDVIRWELIEDGLGRYINMITGETA